MGLGKLHYYWKLIEFKNTLQQQLLRTVFKKDLAYLKKNGVFDINAFRQELYAAISLVGLKYPDFNLSQKDFIEIEIVGSNRLCCEILNCFEYFYETGKTGELFQSPEFFKFYNIAEHGGPNEHTFADLEIILRKRLENIGKTLEDFQKHEDCLNAYREHWKVHGLLAPFKKSKS